MSRSLPSLVFKAGMMSLAAICGMHDFSGAAADSAHGPFHFRDLASEAGLLPAAKGIQGHAAGWGDVDGDGWSDLYLATFFAEGAPTNLLLRNERGRFRADDQSSVRLATRATGSLLVDLDNDGDLDLYVSSMPQPKKQIVGCQLLRNEGGGRFVDVSATSGACPEAFGGRSASAVDVDGDGLLDLLVGEDPLIGYNGSQTRSSRLFVNRGNLKFEDASESAGIPPGTPGLGVAAGDVNGDGWPDLFLAAQDGGNVLLLNDRSGKFRPWAGSRDAFAWPAAGGDNMVCGATLADVNLDGRLDLLLGPHFKTPWVEPVAVRLFLNDSSSPDDVKFREVTADAGLVPLPLKAPHIEVQDFDNDGRPDIGVSIVKFAGGTPHPIIFHGQGVQEGVPRFRVTGLDANDFPTAEDRAARRSGPFFTKMIAEGKILYSAPAPAADYDNDGRVDLVIPSWWPERDSLLLHNETKGGHWLQVSCDFSADQSQRLSRRVNRLGLGARILIYPAGKTGTGDEPIGIRELAVGYGYASAQPAIAHFGLGDRARVDVRVILPHGRGVIEQRDVAADQRIVVRGESVARGAERVRRGTDSAVVAASLRFSPTSVIAVSTDDPAPKNSDNPATKRSGAKKPDAKKSENKKSDAKKGDAKNKPAIKSAAETPIYDTFPPRLPGGEAVVTDTSDAFLKPSDTLRADVDIAKTPPTVDFLYYPDQNYLGKPWSNWGDSLAANGKYYASIGDHLAPQGNGFVYEYDPAKKSFRKLLDLKQLLPLPEGHYIPGKIHSRLDLGRDGWLYCSTHRGSTTVTADKFHYEGDWIVRCHPETGRAEVVVRGPVPKHCIPTSVLDPERLIFYGGTAEGTDAPTKGIQFFAYDVGKKQLLYSGPDGPPRYLIFARSTGRVYYTPGTNEVAKLRRWDPQQGGAPVELETELGLRAATEETPQGIVYSASTGQGKSDALLWAFDVKTERAESLGPAAVGSQAYIATLDADPTGRYLYYVPGAHGGSERDGSAVVQFDTKTRRRKVLAFLHPFYQGKYGCALKGTYSVAVDPAGDKLYITWNASRGSRAWDCCALTVVHIPASERSP